MSKEDSLVPFTILASFGNLISSNIYNTFVRLLLLTRKFSSTNVRHAILERDFATWFFLYILVCKKRVFPNRNRKRQIQMAFLELLENILN